MPRAPSLCSEPNCTNTTYRGKCAEHAAKYRREIDQRRPGASARGYDRKWARTRGAFLRAHPWCECPDCQKLPLARRPAAVDAHHKDLLGPNGPNGRKWFNLEAMAHDHHGRVTARAQPGGWAARQAVAPQ